MAKVVYQSFFCHVRKQLFKPYVNVKKLRSYSVANGYSVGFLKRTLFDSLYFSMPITISCINKCSAEFLENKNQILGQVKATLLLSFTCKICRSKITKYISKQAYTNGIVIVNCDGCNNKHLIADNLGWFPNADGMRNIEEIMASKGETVKKTVTPNGCYEIE